MSSGIEIRCHFCSTTIAHAKGTSTSTHILDMIVARERAAAAAAAHGYCWSRGVRGPVPLYVPVSEFRFTSAVCMLRPHPIQLFRVHLSCPRRVQMLYAKKDEVSLVLFGTEDSSNSMFASNSDGDTAGRQPYEHIVDLSTAFAPPQVSTVRKLGKLPDSNAGVRASTAHVYVDSFLLLQDKCALCMLQADLLDALAICVNKHVGLSRKLGAKYKPGNGRIVVITDAATPMRPPPPGEEHAVDEMAGSIIEKICELHLTVQFFTFEPPADAPAELQARIQQSRSLVARILDATEGVDIPVRDAIHLLGKLRAKTVSQVTKFRGDFDIGGVVKIPVFTYGYTAEAKLPTLKKLTSRKAEAELNAMAGVRAEEEGDEAAAGEGGAGSDGESDADAKGIKSDVVFERRYYRGDTEEKKELDTTEMVKGYLYVTTNAVWSVFQHWLHYLMHGCSYGKEKIVLEPADEDELKLSATRQMSLLAFTSTAAIPRYCIIANTDVVVPPPNNPIAANALSVCARALAETKQAAIVRYVKRAGGAPAVGILIPALAQEDDATPPSSDPFLVRPSPLDIDCLFFLPLPYAEDIRNFTFPSFADTDPVGKLQPSAEQLEAADKLITSMDLMHVVSVVGM